jgi:hypothetical protein
MLLSTRRFLRMALVAAVLTLVGAGCVVHTHPAPPPPPIETKGPPPHAKAKWVPGHYKWQKATRSHVWVGGHWKR